MGRYSRRLGDEFVRVAGVAPGERVLDVGCGTGALTRRLAEVVGPERVAAADPSAPFVEGCRRQVPGADVRLGSAEALPFEDDAFDCSLAQLVFHFVDDPAAAVEEMARVTRPGGRVAANVWDFTGGMRLISAYWEAAITVDPDAPVELGRFGGRPGELAGLWREAGLAEVAEGALTVTSEYRDFDELWETFLGGVGPTGAHAVSLDDERRQALRDALRTAIGGDDRPFSLSARAWYAVGVA